MEPSSVQGESHLQDQDSSWVGRVIEGRYRVDAVIGQGGMGVVLLAEHLKLQKKVALKVILPEFAGSGELAARFAREAMASAKLDHPHIASALDYGTLEEGGAYLVMQYVKGKSLREHMAEHAGDWLFACEVGAQIADALAAAHAAGIVHRDLKPENIMLEQREDQRIHVRVLDFGIARVLDEQGGGGGERGKLTRAGTVLGTPGYMAPEQALGEPVDGRADLYALGVILWECIAGRDLFVGNDVASIISAQLTQVPDSLRLYAPSIPAELDALVMKLLATKKEDRLASPTHVRDVLHRYVLEHKLERIRETKGGTSQTKAWVAMVQQAARLVTKSITQRLSSIPLKEAIEGIDGWLARFPMLADKRRRVMAMAAGASLAFVLF
ncbi:MAG: serine/threonine-protein kinase, partial [Sandaracinaceae bacterium]|nr:serine/threonine-protein kinase [Sandaracinaceae bacterium]